MMSLIGTRQITQAPSSLFVDGIGQHAVESMQSTLCPRTAARLSWANERRETLTDAACGGTDMADGSKVADSGKRAVDAGDAGRLHAGLRQRLRDRGAAGRAARRAELAAAHGLRALCRAAVGLALHRAARHQRALLALPHPPLGAARAEVQEDGAAPLEDGAVARRARPPDRPAALGAGADPEGEAHLPHRHAHHDDGRRRQHAGRHGGARLSRHPVDGRTTTSTTPTARCWSCRSRARCASSPSSAASRRGPARSASSRAASSSRSSWSTARRAATCARTTAPSSRCPTAGRSAPTASPTRATSRRRWRPSRTRRSRAG